MPPESTGRGPPPFPHLPLQGLLANKDTHRPSATAGIVLGAYVHLGTVRVLIREKPRYPHLLQAIEYVARVDRA